MQNFISKNEDAAAKASQDDFIRSKAQGFGPKGAQVYSGQQTISAEQGGEPTEVQAPWGTVVAMPGDWIFTSPEGSQFVVHDEDVQTLWQSV